MIEATDIEQMEVEERLRVMELLWVSLTRRPDAVPSPEWHGTVLAHRLAQVQRGEGQFLTVSQVKERLLKPAS